VLFQTLVARLLENGDFNVIVVHWGAGAYTTYGQAVANTRLVGLEIAFLVNTLIVCIRKCISTGWFLFPFFFT
jgi:pancreatic triacylglycerol lipase